MSSLLTFAVGSENPVKINCVAEAIAAFWPEARAVGIRTESGVSAQPDSDHEMLLGALNRANQALAKTPEARFGVGLEGGTLDAEDGMWAYAWIVVVESRRPDRQRAIRQIFIAGADCAIGSRWY